MGQPSLLHTKNASLNLVTVPWTTQIPIRIFPSYPLFGQLRISSLFATLCWFGDGMPQLRSKQGLKRGLILMCSLFSTVLYIKNLPLLDPKWHFMFILQLFFFIRYWPSSSIYLCTDKCVPAKIITFYNNCISDCIFP